MGYSLLIEKIEEKTYDLKKKCNTIFVSILTKKKNCNNRLRKSVSFDQKITIVQVHNL